jgi:DNA processing protein
VSACPECLRRSWLIARLAAPIERARERAQRLPGLLAIADGALLAALGGPERETVASEYAGWDAAAARACCNEAGVEPLCKHDTRYPRPLKDLPDPPATLFVAGAMDRFLASLEEKPVAVVGARRASSYGLEVAGVLGRGLAAAGLTVVSGMALGVDSAAHAGALEARGTTVAVLGGGAERAYPASKRALHERIRASGAVISELPPGAVAQRWSFPARNRIIAALSVATVVVEAGERSGSLITASVAGDLGREVGAVPGRVTAPLAHGTNELLHDGANVVRGAQDALDLACGAGVLTTARDPARGGLRPELRELFEAIGDGDDSVARLCARGFDAHRVQAGLAELELLGSLRRQPGGRYSPTL